MYALGGTSTLNFSIVPISYKLFIMPHRRCIENDMNTWRAIFPMIRYIIDLLPPPAILEIVFIWLVKMIYLGITLMSL
jgi:hypothetical protein